MQKKKKRQDILNIWKTLHFLCLISDGSRELSIYKLQFLKLDQNPIKTMKPG